jgi:Zn-dependent protease
MSLPGPEAHQVVIASFIASLSPGGASMAQPVVMLCSLAILINLMLCIFNLFPIPPLDGSRLIRNLLPYNAMQAYDRIPIWVSYLLMIFVGGFVIRLFLGPALEIIYTALRMV